MPPRPPSDSDPPHPAHGIFYRFDAERVAWLETRMWEAYYAHQHFRLFLLLVRLVQSQFGISWRNATRIATMIARPAMRFARMIPAVDAPGKKGDINNNASAYAFVIADLTTAYEEIRVLSGAPTTPQRLRGPN